MRPHTAPRIISRVFAGSRGVVRKVEEVKGAAILHRAKKEHPISTMSLSAAKTQVLVLLSSVPTSGTMSSLNPSS